jgi:Glycosyltransferase family 28 C-terminal domain
VLRPRSPTTSTSAAVLMTYRKDGTAVASSVSFLFRDNTFEVRAVPLRTAVDGTAASIAEITWKTLGLRGGRRTPDPWPDICAADVVITHAGQSCVADVAAARRPAIVLPQPRPFDEQHATAETLRRHRLAVAHPWLARCSGRLAVLHRARASRRPKQLETMANHRCCGARR